jgi:hypothetical protein
MAVVSIATKEEALQYLDQALLRGHYTMDEITIAKMRAVRDFVDSLDILDGK